MGIRSTVLLPRHHAADVLRAIRGLREHLAPVLQIGEIRSVVADDLWLSPSYSARR